jgi:trehalose/maltose hydrolase-like predicted phosphorylase
MERRALVIAVGVALLGCQPAPVPPQEPGLVVIGNSRMGFRGDGTGLAVHGAMTVPNRDSPLLERFGEVEEITLDVRTGTYEVQGSKAKGTVRVHPSEMAFDFQTTPRQTFATSEEFRVRGAGVLPNLDVAWQKFWQTDIVIEGPADDQAAVRRHLYYLRVFGPAADGRMPGVFGTGSQKYNGHIFWDHDVWIFPALMWFDPTAAVVIPRYRIAGLAAAERNTIRRGEQGARYPWEGNPAGTEATAGDNVRQWHVNGAVALGLRWASQAGLVPAADAERVRDAIAKNARSVAMIDGGLVGLEEVYGPDEYHLVDNDLYTNALAADLLGLAPRIPRDGDGRLLAFEGDARQNYQQANAILAAWPLQDEAFENQAVEMVGLFGPGVTANGPAMTKSVEALLLARFGSSQEAYERWRRSFEDYERGSLRLFCETPQSKDGPFLTGVAGCLNAVLYGFVGLRLDDEPWPDAAWKRQLASGAWVSIRPNLPPTWQKVTLTKVWFDGVPYRVEATQRSVVVTPLGG